MSSDFQLNNVFRGDFIVAQTEVIFFRRKKKKKPTPKRCILLITHDTVALTDPKKDNKPMLMFPRNTITDFRYNTDDLQYKLEVSVWVKDKTHELCIEFPTHDAKQQRDIFIKQFTNDKAQPIQSQHQSQPQIKTEPNTNNNQPIKQQQIKPETKNKNAPPNTQPLSQRHTKRKHHTMNEETLRKRACKLAKHKYLATLYKTLVGKNVLTPNEFWDEYGADIDIKQSSNGLIEGMSNMVLETTINNQTWSLFSEFKDDIDNENEMNENENDKRKLKINLTAERILKIFVNLPEVKLAYDKNVPFNFSEAEFWKSFLQSHYFKRATTKNLSSGISDKETQMDKLLKKYLQELKRDKKQSKTNTNNKLYINNNNSFAKQLQRIQLARNKEVNVEGAIKRMKEDIAMSRAMKEGNVIVKNIESGNINVNEKGECMDVVVKVKEEINKMEVDDKMKGKTEEKGVNYRRKLNIEDASVDLGLSQDCFGELIDDPGVDEGKNMRRDDIKHWFSQVNKHGMMLLYQSVHQKDMNKCGKMSMEELMINVPKVSYGNKYKMELNECDEENGNEFDGLDVNYLERLERDSEFEDLKIENDKNFIELRIKDQNVYWGDNLLLNDQQFNHINAVAKQMNAYLGQVNDKKKKLAESFDNVGIVIKPQFVHLVINNNTENNYKNNIVNRMDEKYDENVLVIYGKNGNGEIKANKKILDQLSDFQKPMKELVRHYWNCFPANKQRLKKSTIIVMQLKEYKATLVKFQNSLDKKANEYRMQKVLLQELIDLADKVLEHNENTEDSLKKKEVKKIEVVNLTKMNVDE